MARANDNWERLMGAVMRRNSLWEMFHARSRTPSISSAASSADDPFLDLSDLVKFGSRDVEDKGNGKTAMDKRVGEMVKRGRLFDEVIASHEERPPVSGGGLTHCGKISYGYASSPGRRSSMEEFYDTRIDRVDGERVALVGVLVGHGGARAAEYVKKNLFSNLLRHSKLFSDTISAITDAYSHTHEFLKSENNQNEDAGSTACKTILVADRLLVANVGDLGAIICRSGNAIVVSGDHRPNRSDERRRIEDAGGVVMWTGRTWTVEGVLALSRAFGRLLKKYIVANPEIQGEEVDETLEFLILASNGLWGVVTKEEAISITTPIKDPQEAARSLMQEAYRRGSADNITIVVVRFV